VLRRPVESELRARVNTRHRDSYRKIDNTACGIDGAVPKISKAANRNAQLTQEATVRGINREAVLSRIADDYLIIVADDDPIRKLEFSWPAASPCYDAQEVAAGVEEPQLSRRKVEHKHVACLRNGDAANVSKACRFIVTITEANLLDELPHRHWRGVRCWTRYAER